MKRGPYKHSEVIYDNARELRKQGFGYRTIAAKLNYEVSWETIRNWVKDITSEIRKAHKLSEDLFKRPFKPYEEIQRMRTRKQYLIREHGHQCEMCLNETWLNEKIPIEIHHIDGSRHNNSLENLKLLCPNCHALTDTYKGKNIKKFLITNSVKIQ